MRYTRGEVRVPPEKAEETRTALLLERLPGWEENGEGEALSFVFYCPMTEELGARKAAVEGRLHATVAWSVVDDEDWAHAWKRFWKPLRIGRRLVVKPTWEPFEPSAGDIVIELDPGMAFGSGTHETTRMCMLWLEDVLEEGERVLDVGTGSGILAVTAARLGAREVIAVDNDPVAVRTALENVTLNRVADRVRVENSDLTAVIASDERFDVIVANIVADAIIGLAPRVAPLLEEGGRFVASGIIVERVSEVRVALDEAGLVRQDWRPDGEWASVCAAAD
jgi:ribosomal protein L11 methyltransferase